MVAALVGEISAENANYFCSQLDELIITTPDPFDIDFILASRLRVITPPTIYALALTIHLPQATQPCGGLVGNPHQTIESADPYGLATLGARGLSVAAFPGGPGVIVQGSEQLAQDALHQVAPQSCTLEALRTIVDYASCGGAPLVVAVSDGSGRGMQGGILSFFQGTVSHHPIPMHA
jgi:hypothetical protein